MNYFHMSYAEVLQSPMQRLIMLAKGIPKYKSKNTEGGNSTETENKKPSIFEFAKNNNLIKKKE